MVNRGSWLKKLLESRKTPTRYICSCLLVIIFVSWTHTCYGQGSSGYPRNDYWHAMSAFNEGEFRTAATAFSRTSRVKSTDGEWIDSICHHAMLGECFYQMGQARQALQQYDQALNIFVANQQWIMRLYIPNVLPQTYRSTRKVTWGPSTRQMTLGKTPDTVSIFRGNLNNFAVLQQGGTVQPAMLTPMHAREIVRCTALAIRRRTEILGLTCRYSPLTQRILGALELRPAPANHWSQGWISLMLGLAKYSVGQTPAAIAELQSAISFGRLDHELTGLILLELGKMAFEQQQHAAAAQNFFEASLSAAFYQSNDIVEEAMRWGVLNHVAAGQPGLYRPLVQVAEYARLESDWLSASVYVSAAENYVRQADAANAKSMINKARGIALRAEMINGEIGARLHFVNTLAEFQTGNLVAGEQSMAKLMVFQKDASAWLLQIEHAEALYRNGSVTERTADLLFERVLRDPVKLDWMYAPRDSLKYLLTDHEPVMHRWFELALNRREVERAVEITDRIRRHRFYKSLPMGGRVLSLRWILEGPEKSLSATALQQRQQLLAAYPKYQQNRVTLDNVKKQLADLPLSPEQADQQALQKQGFPILAQGTVAQELLLRRMALEPNPAEFSFPPLFSVKKLRTQLAADEAVISFFQTSRALHAFMLSNKKYLTWRVGSPAKVQTQLQTLLRAMGHFDGNKELTTAMLVDDTWKEAATKLAALLFGDATENPFADIQRVVIVPDGVLWYVPFELLPLNEKPLIESYSFRYSPTVSLSLGDGRNQRPLNRTAIMDGPFHLRDDEPARTARIAEFKKFVPAAETLATPLPGAGVHVAGMADRLVVLQDMVQTGNGGYGWSILPKTAGSTLGDWMRLPWGQCEVVCLPGFKTGAESGLKRHASGNDLFLTTCGLMASGSRTVVLSRWRTGGASTYVMMGEFLEKAQTQGAEQAWRSAVNKVRAGESAAGTEPRIRDEGQPTKTSHPFFWSGYMMVDISARSGNAVSVNQLQVAPNVAAKPNINVPKKPQKNINLGNP